jgi:hypothetical protein
VTVPRERSLDFGRSRVTSYVPYPFPLREGNGERRNWVFPENVPRTGEHRRVKPFGSWKHRQARHTDAEASRVTTLDLCAEPSARSARQSEPERPHLCDKCASRAGAWLSRFRGQIQRRAGTAS